MASRTHPDDGARPEPLGPAALLATWEEGRGQGAAERALTLLRRALPVDREALADLPVGRRDALLLALRERTFGSAAECVVSCASCGQVVEFTLHLGSLATDGPVEAEGLVEWGDLRLRVRAATTRDLLALAGLREPAAMVDGLLQRCAAVADPRGEPDRAAVPAAATDAVAAEMARLDPGADLRLQLSCPACGAEWTSVFDVGSYLWREVDAVARRLLGEVHALARAYGWSEDEILGLSPARRRAYLEMVGSS